MTRVGISFIAHQAGHLLASDSRYIAHCLLSGLGSEMFAEDVAKSGEVTCTGGLSARLGVAKIPGMYVANAMALQAFGQAVFRETFLPGDRNSPNVYENLYASDLKSPYEVLDR